MAKLESESAVELLMEHSKMTEQQAWDIVLRRIQDDKENEPPKEPKEKKQKFLLVADPKGTLPDSLLAYVGTCYPTPFTEDTYILDHNNVRSWGLSEASTIYELAKQKIKTINGQDVDDLALMAGCKHAKQYGLTISKEPLLIVPVDTKTMRGYFPDYVTNVTVSADDE